MKLINLIIQIINFDQTGHFLDQVISEDCCVVAYLNFSDFIFVVRIHENKRCLFFD